MALATKQLRNRIDKYNAQLSAAQQALADAPTDDDRAALSDVVQTIRGLRDGAINQLDAGPIREMPDMSTPKEVEKARLRQAVRHRDRTYLPLPPELAQYVLPKTLLHSSLFAATTAEGPVARAPIATLGDDLVIEFSGERLISYDRKIFAACLAFYRDKPLADHTGDWQTTTFYQFAARIDTAYGLGTHKAIRDSLVRLNAATIRVRTGRLDVPLPRLVDVAFDDGTFGDEGSGPRGSDEIRIRVSEQIAQLFAAGSWTAISTASVHDTQGLAAWLLAFYRTHHKAKWLSIPFMRSLSGSPSALSSFRNQLRKSLTRLSDPAYVSDASERVVAFELTEPGKGVNADRVLVRLARFKPDDADDDAEESGAAFEQEGTATTV